MILKEDSFTNQNQSETESINSIGIFSNLHSHLNLDSLMSLTSFIFNTPISSVILSDQSEEKFTIKYKSGKNKEFNLNEFPLYNSTLSQNDILEIKNISKNPNYSSINFLKKENINYFCGIPLISTHSKKIGIFQS